MKITKRLFGVINSAVYAASARSGRRGDLGEALVEAGYRIGRNWMVPDVSVTHAGQPEGKYLEGAPALAIEVISESIAAQMMQRKMRLYFGHGAREVWLVYPETKSVSIVHEKTATEVEGSLKSELLPGISIDLAAVFGRA